MTAKKWMDIRLKRTISEGQLLHRWRSRLEDVPRDRKLFIAVALENHKRFIMENFPEINKKFVDRVYEELNGGRTVEELMQEIDELAQSIYRREKEAEDKGYTMKPISLSLLEGIMKRDDEKRLKEKWGHLLDEVEGISQEDKATIIKKYQKDRDFKAVCFPIVGRPISEDEEEYLNEMLDEVDVRDDPIHARPIVIGYTMTAREQENGLYKLYKRERLYHCTCGYDIFQIGTPGEMAQEFRCSKCGQSHMAINPSWEHCDDK